MRLHVTAVCVNRSC